MSKDDVHERRDSRNILLDKVGIKNLQHPLHIKTEKGLQPVTALVDLFVELPSHVKGTHLSRFIEIFNERKWEISTSTMKEILQLTLANLKSSSAYLRIQCPFFLEKEAPVSKTKSLMNYQLEFIGELTPQREVYQTKIQVPVMSLCPCSKEMSKHNAHNQRTFITVCFETHHEELNIEELIRLLESQGSAELYGALKRPDEKFITEASYENPKFVEDIVRDITLLLQKNKKILSFTVECESLESIHNHSAYASKKFTAS